jgi:hypothetical protein
MIIIQSQPVRLSQECRGGKDRKGGGGGGGGTSRWVEMTGGAHLVEMRWTGCKNMGGRGKMGYSRSAVQYRGSSIFANSLYLQLTIVTHYIPHRESFPQ